MCIFRLNLPLYNQIYKIKTREQIKSKFPDAMPEIKEAGIFLKGWSYSIVFNIILRPILIEIVTRIMANQYK